MNNKLSVHSIAGFCNEKAIWKMVADLSSNVLAEQLKTWIVINPGIVLVDGENFRIDANIHEADIVEFYPPEGTENYGEEGYVWSLGALVCYASSGHYVFGGQGGSYQHDHPNVELPTLRKEHTALTAIVKGCLCYSSSQRMKLRELHDLAIKGLASCNQTNRVKRLKEPGESRLLKYSDDVWPEIMDN